MTEMDIEQEVEQDDVAEVPEDQGSEETPEQASAREEAEAEARKYGWRPREDYDKAPEGWVDAQRFMEFPTTQVKVLRDTKRELERRISEAERQSAEKLSRFEASQKEVRERIRAQEKARFDAELGRIQQQKREAAASHDLDRYDQLSRQEAQLSRPQEPEEPKDARPPQPPQAVVDYVQKNEWAQNPVLWREALDTVNHGLSVGAVRPNDPEGQLAYAEKMMRQARPHLFPAPAKQVSRVDGGGLATGRQKGKGASELPADVMAVAKDYVREGIYKSVDEYAKDYWSMGAAQ